VAHILPRMLAVNSWRSSSHGFNARDSIRIVKHHSEKREGVARSPEVEREVYKAVNGQKKIPKLLPSEVELLEDPRSYGLSYRVIR
jgi:hypothetical protein